MYSRNLVTFKNQYGYQILVNDICTVHLKSNCPYFRNCTIFFFFFFFFFLLQMFLGLGGSVIFVGVLNWAGGAWMHARLS